VSELERRVLARMMKIIKGGRLPVMRDFVDKNGGLCSTTSHVSSVMEGLCAKGLVQQDDKGHWFPRREIILEDDDVIWKFSLP
jgi:hypothetical protein